MLKQYYKGVAKSQQPFPSVRPAKDAEKYADELFVKETSDISKMKESFEQMLKLFPIYCFGSMSDKKVKESAVWPIQVFENSHWVSKLFWGQDLKGTKLTYKMIEDLLGDEAEMQQCLERRKKYKVEFLEGLDSKYISTPQGTWVVFKDIDLPFIVVVDLLWFNSKSITPDVATLSEMQQAGRIVNGNKCLYEKKGVIAPLLASLIQLEQYVVFDYSTEVKRADLREEDKELRTLFTDWWRPDKFNWNMPMHDTIVTHIEGLGWSTFLAFPRELVMKNLDKVILRKGTVLTFFAGELRVHNIYEKEDYALTYIKKMVKDKELEKDTSYLIYTTDKKRLGVSSLPFFSNHTCDDNTWFRATGNDLATFKLYGENTELQKEHKTSSIVVGANEMYRHRTLTVRMDITGAMFKDKYDALFANEEAKTWRMLPIEMEIMQIPLEWKYHETDKPVGDEDKTCRCLTKCHFADPKSRSRAPFGDTDFPVRPDPVHWNMEKVTASEAKVNKSYIELYLSQFPPLAVASGDA